MTRTILLIPLVAALLACGLLTQDDEPPLIILVTPDAPAEGTTQQIEESLPPPPETERIAVATSGDVARPLYAGDSTIEEKIIENSIIVEATMTSLASEIIIEADGRYAAVLKFNLDVSEYLKGTGPSSIVAVWVDGRSYDSRAEADAAEAEILARRDDQWDEREAVIFLYGFLSGFGSSLDAQLELADHFLLYVGDPHSYDDFYSLHSREHRSWLPAASSAGSTGDGQEFLLEVPTATRTAPTITLGDLKTRIAEVTAELGGGDGSEAHRACVLEKYRYLRNQRNFPEERDRPFTIWNIDQSFVSGQSAGTVIDVREAYGVYPDTKITLRIEGRDSAFFDTADGDSADIDDDGDGDFDTIKYDQMVTLVRPVPAGEYSFRLTESWPEYALCNFDISNDWAVTAVAPEGTLHEAFFDPVTDGTAVAADVTNGVLKPATFTDPDGAAATIERIEWESGTVKFELSSDHSLAGQVVHFIELDGAVSLSLNADDATVDAANDTLSWPVASQPWEDGDKLMLRIREARGTCWNGTAVPNLSANPGLASDCNTLLAAKDALRGTATLNWSADTAITSWDGVTVKGTPSRVVEIILTDKSLTGTIPPELAKLTGLQSLHLYENQLTGSIPTEFGSLTALTDLRLYGNRLSGGIPTEMGGLSRLVVLYLDDNQLTGPIPSELGSLTNLRDLFLTGNRLTGGIPTQLGALSNLRFLNLDGNQLTGGIPGQLGSLTNMQDLSLSSNRLTGSIPTQLGDLTNLRDLFLNDNQLTGSVPTQLGKLTNLETLDLSGNGLTGSIASELGKLSKLESLYLRNNQLTGAIPAQLGSLSNLDTLRLFGNTLTGCIPSALRNIDDHDLARLRLQYCAAP